MLILGTIIVTKKLFSKYRTIQSAVNHAQPGDTIVLEPGKYKEHVKINKPVSIVGEGKIGEVVFSGDILAKADLTLKNIVFNPEYSLRTQISLRIEHGKTTVEECSFMKARLVSIYVIESEASLEVKNSTFSNGNKGIEATDGASYLIQDSKFINLQSNGFVAMENATGTIERCEFKGIQYPSLFIGEGAEVTVQDCKIHSGAFRAVDFERGKGAFINCEIYENKETQMYIDESDVSIKDCQIYSGGETASGIQTKDANIVIENTIIRNHEHPQIFAEKTTIHIKNSKIFDAPNTNGIRLIGESNGTIEDCELYNHGFIQVSVEKGSYLSIRDCKIHNGVQSAIEFEDGKGIVENCQLYQNSSGQLYLSEGSEVTVTNTRIYEPKPESYGCYVIESSKLVMNDCEIEEHEHPQVYADQSVIELNGIKIHGGKGNGIRMVNETEGIVRDSDIYQHGDYPQIAVENSSKIHMIQSKIYSNNGAGIIFEKAKGIIEDCSIYENGWRQVDVDEESDVQFIGTEIYGGKEETNGVVVTGASTAEFVRCAFSNHEFPQLFIDEKSKFQLRESKIFDGRDSCGIRIVGATGTIEHCEFSNNGEYPHIVVEQQSEVEVLESRIHSGQGLGVVISDSKGTIQDCDIFNNVHSQLQIEEGANVEVNNCRIYDGNTHGIRVSSSAKALIQDVSIYGHKSEYAQVVVKEGGNPIFQRCKVYDGAGDGFFFFDKGLGTVEDCYIYNNADSNFCIVTGSEPVLRRNRILNGKFGVYMEEASPIIENCIFNDHVFEDLYFDEKSNPVLIQNEFNSIREYEAKQETQGQDAAKYEEVLGFNPYELDLEELKARLIAEKRKWINRMNAPNVEKRQEAERALMLIEELEKELILS